MGRLPKGYSKTVTVSAINPVPDDVHLAADESSRVAALFMLRLLAIALYRAKTRKLIERVVEAGPYSVDSMQALIRRERRAVSDLITVQGAASVMRLSLLEWARADATLSPGVVRGIVHELIRATIKLGLVRFKPEEFPSLGRSELAAFFGIDPLWGPLTLRRPGSRFFLSGNYLMVELFADPKGGTRWTRIQLNNREVWELYGETRGDPDRIESVTLRPLLSTTVAEFALRKRGRRR